MHPRSFMFGGSAVNRLISFVGFVLVSIIGTAMAGYWNARGVVPVGDARIPGWMVGSLIVGLVGLFSGLFGGKVAWTSIVMSVIAKAKESQSSLAATVAVPTPVKVPAVQTTRESVGAIPVQVEHLLGCVYHLRVALKSDDEGQELLDQIQIKIGRVSAQVGLSSKQENGGE